MLKLFVIDRKQFYKVALAIEQQPNIYLFTDKIFLTQR